MRQEVTLLMIRRVRPQTVGGAFDGRMQLPQWLARFNRYVTNPVQRLWAGWLPGFGIIEHVGRRSGKPYRTPVNVFATDDGLAILLTYGPNRDWLKNLTAAGLSPISPAGEDARGSAPWRPW